MASPWQNEETLRELYIKQDLSTREVADELGCSKRTIQRWLDKFDIPTDPSTHEQGGPWRDRETMIELYEDEGMSIQQIADELNTGNWTIQTWLDKHEIDTRESYKHTDFVWQDKETLRELHLEKQMPASEIADALGCTADTIRNWLDKYDVPRLSSFPTVSTDRRGYVIARDGRGTQFNLHRLIAVAEHSFDEVAGNEIHHENGIPWDNRPENLTPMPSEEHARTHAEEQAEWRSRDPDGRFA